VTALRSTFVLAGMGTQARAINLGGQRRSLAGSMTGNIGSQAHIT
jgi:hypothetical protein